MNGKTPSGNAPVGYMERTRLYYRALGYERDYVWARFDEVPFARLKTPLSGAKLALVTTAVPPDLADPHADGIGGRKTWTRDVDDVPARMHTDHVAWDKESTHTRDRESYLPIDAVSALAAEGIVGGLTGRIYGAATVYSQRRTIEEDAPAILKWIVEDAADAVLLTAL